MCPPPPLHPPLPCAPPPWCPPCLFPMASAPPIDLDSLPAEVTDQLLHLDDLPSAPSGLLGEYENLLSCMNFSLDTATETERKVEEIYAEIHFAREQVVAAQRVEDEAMVMKKGLEGSIEEGRKKADEYRKQEAIKKESVAEYRVNIERLKKELEAGSGWTYEQTTAKKSLMMQRDNVERNLDNVKSVLKATRSEVEHVTDAGKPSPLS